MFTTLNYSPNFDLKKRKNTKINFLIFHYTGMRHEKEAIKKLTSLKSKVSCHYFVKKNGEILNLVPDLYIAWHAGISRWKNFSSLNKNSIGIEISNPGHSFIYDNFTKNQINSIYKLNKFFTKKYKIKKKNILGHSDIAPLRKLDPGEKFPWKYLSKKKIGIWHTLNPQKLKSLRKKKSDVNLVIFLNYLKKIGYCVKYSNAKELSKIIKIFQMRFRPEIINGKLDFECYEIAKSLKNLK